MNPTEQQLLKTYIVCSSLTQMYQPIYLVTLDERTGMVYILAGEDIQFLVDQDGEVTQP